jgi:hypothetical protein
MTDALFDTAQKSSVTAFKPGFRMLVGNVNSANREDARKFRQLTYTCMQNEGTRAPEYLDFPDTPCPSGIMANHRFPTCWDGVNLDSPNHQDHVSYPESGTFESGGPCPASHPIKIPQLLLETVWDTKAFNNKADWPADGSQPFVWSSGDKTGYSTHADYLFGWKDNSLQKAMDGHTYVSTPSLKTQNIAAQNKCTVKDMVGEDFDSCKLYRGRSANFIIADVVVQGFLSSLVILRLCRRFALVSLGCEDGELVLSCLGIRRFIFTGVARLNHYHSKRDRPCVPVCMMFHFHAAQNVLIAIVSYECSSLEFVASASLAYVLYSHVVIMRRSIRE